MTVKQFFRSNAFKSLAVLIAIVLFLIMLIFTYIQLRLTRSSEDVEY